jgi:hypothetical protein
MNAFEWLGLLLVVSVPLIIIIVLLIDAIRLISGVPTFSELIWAKYKAYKRGEGAFPVWGVILPALLVAGGVVGAVGLVVHFFL